MVKGSEYITGIQMDGVAQFVKMKDLYVKKY